MLYIIDGSLEHTILHGMLFIKDSDGIPYIDKVKFNQSITEYHVLYGEPYVEYNQLYPDIILMPLQVFSKSFLIYDLVEPTKPHMKHIYNEEAKGYEEKIMWRSTNRIWVQYRKITRHLIDIIDISNFIMKLGQTIVISNHGIETTVGWIPTEYDYPEISTLSIYG